MKFIGFILLLLSGSVYGNSYDSKLDKQMVEFLNSGPRVESAVDHDRVLPKGSGENLKRQYLQDEKFFIVIKTEKCTPKGEVMLVTIHCVIGGTCSNKLHETGRCE
ncbi:hypothetical protein KUV95_17175 [Microbulbifer agarilyticus]|uniref:hypothetical protein n=1 Tax=Microbulbifer agarilyticus TaxID=260552 RepID=UPI001C944A0C|nr:hypothetical protein [Microbulbifer agarilyticus]MBY6213278.1 hypothetical protein [Microbulbifer agarilyticus]